MLEILWRLKTLQRHNTKSAMPIRQLNLICILKQSGDKIKLLRYQNFPLRKTVQDAFIYFLICITRYHLSRNKIITEFLDSVKLKTPERYFS